MPRARTVALALALLGALAGGLLLFGFGGGAESLDVLWVSDTDRPNQVNHHPVAVAGSGPDAVVVAPVSSVSGSGGGCALVALNANGTRRWSQGIRDAACAIHGIGDPAVVDLTGDGDREVLVPTAENAVYGYDVRSGDRTFTGGLTTFGYSKPVVLDDPRRVLAVDFAGEAFAWYPNGSVAWNASVEAGVTADPLVFEERDLVLVGTTSHLVAFTTRGERAWAMNVSTEWLVRVNDTHVVASYGNRVVGVDTSARRVLWTLDTSGRAVVHAARDGDGDGEREVYVGSRGSLVLAVDAGTGVVEWRTRLASGTELTPAPAVGNVTPAAGLEVVAVTHDGTVSVLDGTTGEVAATYRRDVAVWVHPVVANVDADPFEEILVMYGDGRVVALSA